MTKYIMSLLILAGALTLSAQAPSNVRIDIGGVDDGMTYSNLSTLDGKGKIDIHGWDKEKGIHNLYTDLPLTPNTWTQVGFTFTPLADGEITIRMLGVWHKPEGSEKNIPVFAYYDAVEATGAKIMDGDFEKLDENEVLKYWIMGGGEPKAEIIINAKYVKTGKQSIKVWHDAGVSQKIEVKANQPVTIKAWAYVE
jgi:hypothetical protein